MSLNKINYLLLPLLVSILLSTLINLKAGSSINSSFTTLLIPITRPTVVIKNFLSGQLSWIANLPRLSRENDDLRKQNSSLLTENQNLRESIADKQVLGKVTQTFPLSVPIRIVSIGKTITAVSSFDLTGVKPNQPVVSGTTLLGFVQSVSSSIIRIVALDSELSPRFPIKTYLGQTGTFIFDSRVPQVMDIPSENQVNLNDTVLTQPTQDLPSNLVVGKIIKVLSGPQEPLQKAEIKLDLKFTDNPPDLIIVTGP